MAAAASAGYHERVKVHLPFGRETVTVEAPDNATVLRPRSVEPLADETSAVRQALQQPLAGLPLRERVRAGQTVAIVISDVTRPVPNAVLLAPVLEELESAGIRAPDVTIVNGTGLHRPNTDAEIEEMLGAEVLRRCRVVQHEARRPETLVRVGESRGVAVELCRAYVEADVRIVTGFVEPHLFAGYSGGAKGVMPGVAGAEIVMSNHDAANLAHPLARWLVTDGNPVFEEMQHVVELCPPTFLLNVTLDPGRRLTGVFAGDFRAAHAAAVEKAASQYRSPIGRLYDVVVVTNMGYPADTTLYQSVKGMSVAAEGVRAGGAIVLVAGCDEGIGGPEYVGLLRGGKSPTDLMRSVLEGETRHDQWQVQCQAKVQERAEVWLHSRLSRADTESAHLRYAEDGSETVAKLVARERAAGRDGSVLVMPWGQLTVPVAE